MYFNPALHQKNTCVPLQTHFSFPSRRVSVLCILISRGNNSTLYTRRYHLSAAICCEIPVPLCHFSAKSLFSSPDTEYMQSYLYRQPCLWSKASKIFDMYHILSTVLTCSDGYAVLRSIIGDGGTTTYLGNLVGVLVRTWVSPALHLPAL